MTMKVAGTGSFLPKLVVSNDDLAKIMDTSDEWIYTRTGIKERRLVQEESTSYMAGEAARRALTDAGMNAEDIDLIIVGTITGDKLTPSTACEVQAILGADKAVAFDVNAACSGFMYALNTAYAYISGGLYENALVIGVETLSKIMDWEDRSTCVLFGDGAGAVVVKKSDKGMYQFDQGADGKRGVVLTCKNRPANNPYVKNPYVPEYVHMDGQAVYKFAVSTVPESIRKVLDKEGVKEGDIDYYLLHQANVRILQAVSKRLGISEDKFPISLDHCGNISAASVPILLDEVNKKGMLKRGNKLILSGFGGGLTWGTVLLEW